MLKKTTLALSAIAATIAVPAAAEAQSYGYTPYGYQQPYYGQQAYNRYYGQRAYNQRAYGDRYRCKSGTTGMIVGGAAGALAGREIERQSRNRYYYGNRGGTTGALIGGAIGAIAGRAITRTC